MNAEAPGNLVVMYHYVRPHNSDGVTGVTPNEFRRHIQAIRRRYRLVTVEEFIAQRDAEEGLALITFDDAVRDQYDYAFPILEDLGVPSVVFAPMRPYSDEPDRWITQMLLHALAHELGWDELERRIEPFLAGLSVDEAEMNRLYDYEVPRKRRLKYALGFSLPHDYVRQILTEVNRSVGLPSEAWFMTADQLCEIQNAGHAIGGHGFDHVPYNTLTPKLQAADMHRAAATMSRICGAMARPMAYPYGAHSPETDVIARQCGYSYCFTVAERVDAKDLPAHLDA
jgi:peptidoglycan/xylan/chitin deacetylase (PgdA/CDA1 family)